MLYADWKTGKSTPRPGSLIMVDNLTGLYDTMIAGLLIEHKTIGGKMEAEYQTNEVSKKYKYVVLSMTTLSNGFVYDRGRKYFSTIEAARKLCGEIILKNPSAVLVIAKVIEKLEPRAQYKVTKI